jgi:hypothetical protein
MGGMEARDGLLEVLNYIRSIAKAEPPRLRVASVVANSGDNAHDLRTLRFDFGKDDRVATKGHHRVRPG